MAKYIFVTGGVVSSVGKGITTASIGRILKNRKISLSVLKLDPYLNVDPGTMSPYQHGEVFVTEDGSETDLDLGHYERFIDINLDKLSNMTAGQVYVDVLARERKGEFLGGTIQSVPHVTDAIKKRIIAVGDESKSEVVIVEVGGTVGDIEGQPFLEAIRQLRNEDGSLTKHGSTFKATSRSKFYIKVLDKIINARINNTVNSSFIDKLYDLQEYEFDCHGDA